MPCIVASGALASTSTPPWATGWTVTDSPFFMIKDANGGEISHGFVQLSFDPTLPQMTVAMRDYDIPGVSGEPTIAVWTKTYDTRSFDLLQEKNFIWPYRTGDLSVERHLRPPPGMFYKQSVQTETSYNFFGAPLKKTVKEIHWSSASNSTINRTDVTQYAYWGANKYFQRKAVKDNYGRYSLTDYFASAAPAGSRGQQYRVYGTDRGITLDPTASAPAGTDPSTAWRYRVYVPASASKSAEYVYDSKGRVTDLYRLHDTSTTPHTFVRTHMDYGADQAPWWGAATMVTEDYGGINRITQTLASDAAGRPTLVQDAAGRQFQTELDEDGRTLSVTRVDCTPNQPIVTYTYGNTGINNGEPLVVTDGHSGVYQEILYATSGGGKGQPVSVLETNGSRSYTVSYTYTVAGDRATARYVTPNTDITWRYSGYLSEGNPHGPKRVYQTLTKQVGGINSAEELHYQYDTYGRLANAAFAQTPQAGHTNYSDPAAVRARAYYAYDPVGRTVSIEHYWDTYVIPTGASEGFYTSQAIAANACTYEAARGLKLASSFYGPDSAGTGWSLLRTEEFSYDSNLDRLTSADYDDGLANETTSWTYDVAGNRVGDSSNLGTWTYDALDRMSASPGFTYSNDILGNRTQKGSTSGYEWDVVNRMVSYTSGSTTTYYAYRADGMRVTKSDGANTTTYCYDGQMPIELKEVSNNGTTVTSHTLGARGLDAFQTTANSGSSVSFPIYDSHGNMQALLSRAGSSFAISDQKSFDAWGGVRLGNGVGGSASRHSANLGHSHDNESDLIYMRARYYEPKLGRFLSEDPSKQGGNFFAYCSSNPVNKVDRSGKVEIPYLADLLLGGIFVLLGAFIVHEEVSIMLLGADVGAVLGYGLIAAGVVLIITGAVLIAAQLLGAVTSAYLTNGAIGGEARAFALIEEAKGKKSDSAKIGAGMAEIMFWTYLALSE